MDFFAGALMLSLWPAHGFGFLIDGVTPSTSMNGLTPESSEVGKTTLSPYGLEGGSEKLSAECTQWLIICLIQKSGTGDGSMQPIPRQAVSQTVSVSQTLHRH